MKVHKIIAMDVVGVALLAAAITFLGCNKDLTVSAESPAAAAEQTQDTRAHVESVAPQPAQPVETTPKTVREVTYKEAEKAYTERQYELAADLFARYAETKPDNPWGHYMLGLSARQAGVNDTAEEAFVRALELDPKHVKSMINLSRVLLDTNRPEDALNRLDDVFEIDPQSGAAYRLQGRAMHQLGDTADAIAAYQDAIRIDETDAWAINNLALIYIEQGRFEEALRAMARATELRDDVAIFRNNLGMALENTGHFRAAEREYQAAIDRNAGYETAASNLARVSTVDEDASVEPVDLATLSESFVASCEQWAVTSADQNPVEDDIETLSAPTGSTAASRDLAVSDEVSRD